MKLFRRNTTVTPATVTPASRSDSLYPFKSIPYETRSPVPKPNLYVCNGHWRSACFYMKWKKQTLDDIAWKTANRHICGERFDFTFSYRDIGAAWELNEWQKPYSDFDIENSSQQLIRRDRHQHLSSKSSHAYIVYSVWMEIVSSSSPKMEAKRKTHKLIQIR